mgnify:CR=1 FL=1
MLLVIILMIIFSDPEDPPAVDNVSHLLSHLILCYNRPRTFVSFHTSYLSYLVLDVVEELGDDEVGAGVLLELESEPLREVLPDGVPLAREEGDVLGDLVDERAGG